MATVTIHTEQEVWDVLKTIPDPEIPVISVVELGVVRRVELVGNGVVVTITPTYSGCPAMTAFEDDITAGLVQLGYEEIEIKKVYSPAWTTDWLSAEARQKLKEYGIAPPVDESQDKNELFAEIKRKVSCPFCDSPNTKLESQFGSTACKALYYCNGCQQPFEYFKCL